MANDVGRRKAAARRRDVRRERMVRQRRVAACFTLRVYIRQGKWAQPSHVP